MKAHIKRSRVRKNDGSISESGCRAEVKAKFTIKPSLKLGLLVKLN